MSRQLTKITDWSERADKPKAVAAKPVRVALLDSDASQHASFRSHLAACEPAWQLDPHTHGEPAWRDLRAVPPQLVLLAQTLPDGCGLEWLRRCKHQWPELPVILLTTQGSAKTLWDALVSGAQGYWVKRDNTADLVKQLRKVLSGKLVLCEEAERLLLEGFAGLRQRPVKQWGLSRREEEIMTALCRRLSNKEIANALGLSPATVHAHLNRIFKKLNVHDRTAAMQKFSNHLWGGKNAGRDFDRIRPYLDHLENCGMIERVV